jgi:predicted nucleic-acid-binding Zn-ribbon protein
MKQTGKCLKCGCTEVIADAKAIDQGLVQGEMSVATFRKPDARLFKQQQETTVSAWVCSACGYIEYYADHPDKIRLPKA